MCLVSCSFADWNYNFWNEWHAWKRKCCASSVVSPRSCSQLLQLEMENTTLPYRKVLCLLLACGISRQEYKMFASPTCSKAAWLVCLAKCSLPGSRRQVPLLLGGLVGEFQGDGLLVLFRTFCGNHDPHGKKGSSILCAESRLLNCCDTIKTLSEAGVAS